MPTFLGEPFYPHGCPIPPQNIEYGEQTIQKKFLLHCEHKATEEDENILKEYIHYYINAPMFELPNRLKNLDLKAISLDQLIDECIDIGIDPF